VTQGQTPEANETLSETLSETLPAPAAQPGLPADAASGAAAVADSEAADSEATGSDATGSDATGSDVTGSDVTGSDVAASDVTTGKPRIEVLEQEGEIAADYLEVLLDIADLDGDIDMDVVGERAVVSIVGGKLGHLVGRDGEVLEALQELTRLAVMRATGERSRLMLDIDGYRAARRQELTGLGIKAAEDAKSSGAPVKLKPMTPFERKIVHDAVATTGLRSESEGEEPERRVVVFPA
jgi:spoIIIJ-associated protein